MKYFLLFAALFACLSVAQSQKPIEHIDVHRWKKIEQPRLSNNGAWVVWAQTSVTEGDATLLLWNSSDNKTISFPRASEGRFSADSKWLVFRIKPALDSLKNLRRKKTKEENLPGDTLAVYDLTQGRLEKFPGLRQFNLPEYWSDWLFYQIETEKPVPAPKDTSAIAKPDSVKTVKAKPPKTSKKGKKEDKENGYRLIVKHLPSGAQDTIAYVKEYVIAKRAPHALLYATGMGDTLTFPAKANMLKNGVYQLDISRNKVINHWRGKGKATQLALDEQGKQAAFLLDEDSSKVRIRPWQLYFGNLKKDTAWAIANAGSDFLPDAEGDRPGKWGISEYAKPVFSEDGSKLYFGMAPPAVLNDTTLLPEEIVQVEVWAWTEKRMYTQQKVQLENERKKSHTVVCFPGKHKFVRLGSAEAPELRFEERRNANLALAIAEEPYAQYITWEGAAHKDLYAMDLESGNRKRIVKDLRCNPRISPEGKFIVWWSEPDSAWFSWNASAEKTVKLTHSGISVFYDETSDVPDFPGEHGLAGWLEQDEAVLVYDRYDIWQIDPGGKSRARRLTNGRERGIVYRYIKLDPEQHSIPSDARMLLHQFSIESKEEGYAWLDLKRDTVFPWIQEGFMYSKTPIKAKNADSMVFTKENFQLFPDLQFTETTTFQQFPNPLSPRQISRANPQQEEYHWGSIERVGWTSLSGEKLSGLLVKPAGFDPAKQYPMIVNFYEKLSDELHRHRMPDFHRSQINFTVYASRGYLVFAPDIPYRTGYPGECAYDAIVSGVTALIDKGFVDPKRVALQGHSWGGYQAAYLITRTNLFTCAEAGAPVANMTSAYGGIRWESGLSRAFQYERQQSRIGGSLWEYPLRYLENSPLFSLDKVQTPVLILHNDKDGAVPWYQGIELYSGLRRLGKPCWLLNYNDEPHWPVKLQNRIDFQKRMQQFFDFYLMDKPEPKWMKRGVPPLEKGILQGMD